MKWHSKTLNLLRNSKLFKMDKTYSLDDVSKTGHLPGWVTKLLDENKVHTENSMGLLVFILHCLMIESGFIPKHTGSKTFELCAKSDNVYRFKYALSRDGEARQNCILLCMTTGSVVIASGKTYKLNWWICSPSQRIY